jgi:hypothetical protein
MTVMIRSLALLRQRVAVVVLAVVVQVLILLVALEALVAVVVLTIPRLHMEALAPLIKGMTAVVTAELQHLGSQRAVAVVLVGILPVTLTYRIVVATAERE